MSTSSKKTIDEKASNCELCDQVDSKEMVACDVCKLWFHFSCVGVDKGIESISWLCVKCNKEKQQIQKSQKEIDRLSIRTKSVSSSSVKSIAKRKALLDLKKLQEQEQLQKQQIEREENIQQMEMNLQLLDMKLQKQQLERERETNKKFAEYKRINMEKRYQLEERLIEMSEEDDEIKSQISIGNNVEQWVSNQKPHDENLYFNREKYISTPLPGADNIYRSDCMKAESMINSLNVNAPTYEANFNNDNENLHSPRQISRLKQGECYECENKENNNILNNSILTVPYLLSKENIAARQLMGKDLPYFHGLPSEWPLFISTFERTTKICNFTNDENLIRLTKCLKGDALESVRSRLLLPTNVPKVIDVLKQLYGRPQVIINDLLQSIRNVPSPKEEKLDTLIKFSNAVENLCSVIIATNLQGHLNNPTLLQEFVDKLPVRFKIDWAFHIKNNLNVNLATFSDWLSNVSSTINVITPLSTSVRINKDEIKTFTKRRFNDKYQINNTHIEEKNSNKTMLTKINKKCCVCNGSCSTILRCDIFKSYTQGKKWYIVKKFNLCKLCLSSHKPKVCKIDKVCGKDGCNLLHHACLHWDNNNFINKSDSIHQNNLTSASTSTESKPNDQVVGTHQKDSSSTIYKIIPVIVHGKSKSVRIFAYLDDGSSTTLMNEEVCKNLDIETIIDPVCLKWTDGTRRSEEDSMRCTIEIANVQQPNKKYLIDNVHTLKVLNLPEQTINMNKIIKQFPYLKNIPIESYDHAVPQILIGLKQSKLVAPLKCKEGGWNQPVATKTRLGWILHGAQKLTSDQNNSIANNNSKVELINNVHQCECITKQDDDIHNEVKQHFALENLGVVKNNLMESDAVQRARRILKETTKEENNRFEVGLLWKFDKIILPESLVMAKHRYMCLEKKMERDPAIAKNLNEQIKEYISKGYIRKLSEAELKKQYDRVWYLPVFPVTNRNKPGKIRMVWDAAAKSHGVSLNSMLLPGPDELSSLITVLFQFRERRVAICGDIKQMFHQVKIIPDDQQAQRFLWRNEKTSKLDTYVMQVMTFGATCSPSCAQYVKNKNADKFEAEYPKASEVIKNNHYVDDFLYSVDSDYEAIQLANEVKYIHKKGGFEIGKWLSNSAVVMNYLGEDNKADLKNININPEEISEKVLGMWWNRKMDIFTYSLKYNKTNQEILSGKCRPTKREVLRTLMSVFDPLGMLAHFMVFLKIILQDVWRSSIEWDEKILDEQFKDWLTWIHLLPQVEQVRIPRCYLTSKQFSDCDDVQLHTFVDASEKAYACVSYLRVIINQTIECSLIGAKTRVTPLKPISIPRIELQAALLGSRFAQNIVRAHSIEIKKKYFWTDSRTVLCWLNSDHRKYKQFVAFRAGEILEITDLKEWRWIPTKLNIADEATKWKVIPTLNSNSKWFLGPEILKQDEDQWPENILFNISTEELRLNVHHEMLINRNNLIDVKRFSNWFRLLGTQAYVLRFIYNSKKINLEKNTGPLTKIEYIEAENQLYRQAQQEAYSNEILKLKRNSPIEKNSTLYKLSPYLDHNQIIRIHGRIDEADIQFDAKRPIILPRHNSITHLLIYQYHRRYHHHNYETVINEIRQKYYISNLRATVSKVRKLCQKCKNSIVLPKPPEMSKLPISRLTSFTRPFTFAGIDYFGPMLVTNGRKTEKRWGVLITCLTIRAIHIEIAYSLTTDSCILAIRKFISRRGQPNEFHSDNGTNFHGAERELREAFKQINQEKLSIEFTNSITQWKFIPPASPHMGGSWERLVRSVKNTLYQIKPLRNPGDELLYSMLVEVENVVNCRPLTHIPTNDVNEESITPNHFLLGSSNGSKPIVEISDDGKLLRKNWQTSQQYANLFWKKWVREYLPTLTRRTKWFETVPPIKKDDIVIIIDENNPRSYWPKGRVLDTVIGKDGNVRRATVLTKNGIYERPAVKLAVLDVMADDVGKSINEINVPRGSVVTAAAGRSIVTTA